MSKELKAILEFDKDESTDRSQHESVNRSNKSKFFSERVLNNMSVLSPILTFDSYSESSGDSGLQGSPRETPAKSISMNKSSYKFDDDETPTPTPKCMGNLDIHQVRSSLQSTKPQSSSHSRKKLTRRKSDYSTKTVSMLIHEQSPGFLVIESLVWIICSAIEKDPLRKKQMYITLCESMSSLKVLGNSYLEDSLQPLRDAIADAFNGEIRRVQHILNKGVGFCDNPSPFPSISFDLEEIQVSNCSGFFGSNRFLDEFDEIQVISRGGFGIINKSRYKLDNCFYAVKEITFPYDEHENFMQIIREVKLFANLEPHPNVVTYKTAWIQGLPVGTRKSRSRSFAPADIVEVTSSSEETETSTDESADPSTAENDDDDELVRFDSTLSTEEIITHTRDSIVSESYIESSDIISSCSRLTLDDDNCDTSNRFFSQTQCSSQQYSSSHYECTERGMALQPLNYHVKNSRERSHKFSGGISAVLYIQMELCGNNLEEYLRERNENIANSLKNNQNMNDHFNGINVKVECNHFIQILKGIEYIHSKKIIHRDIKPQNILFSIDNTRIKIADFGLATFHCSTNFHPENESNGRIGHTSQLGTHVYAAPEQLNSIDYDYRVDMYSLGLVLYEMFYPFSTCAEKGRLFDYLKKDQQLPQDMVERWPKLCELILKLTQKEPDDRPKDIKEVLILFREAFDDIFLPNLTRKEIENLVSENQYLKKELAEKLKLLEIYENKLKNCTCKNDNSTIE